MPFTGRSGHRSALLLGVAALVAGCNTKAPPTPLLRAATGAALAPFAPGDSATTGARSNSWSAGTPIPAPRTHHALVAAGGSLYLVGGRDADGRVSGSVFEYAPAGGAWSARGAMPSPRASFAAAVAGTGDIYIFGGEDDAKVASRTTFRFTPSANRWSARAPLPMAGSCGSAAANDSVVFVFIGCDSAGRAVRLLYRYDPRTDAFSTLEPPATEHRYGTLVQARGDLFLIGGQDAAGTAVAAVERYQPATNAWSKVTAMRGPRYGHGAVLSRQSVVVAGGATSGDAAVVAGEYLDPANFSWAPRSALPREHRFAGMAALGGRIFVAGGTDATGQAVSTVDVFAHGDFWLEGPPMPTGREATVAGQIDGVIYVAGGFQAKAGLVPVTEGLDTRTMTWRTVAPQPAFRAHAMGAVSGGRFYVMGGNSISMPKRVSESTVYAYDPAADRWTEMAPLPMPGRWGGTAVTLGDSIFVTSGSNVADDFRNADGSRVMVYEVARNVWHILPLLPDWTKGAPGVALDGKIYLVGGTARISAKSDVAIYDPRTSRWSKGPPLPVAATFPTAAVVRGTLYAIGGGNTESYALSAVQRFDPAAGTWREAAPLPLGIVASVAVESGGAIYVLGGKTINKHVTGRVFVYLP